MADESGNSNRLTAVLACVAAGGAMSAAFAVGGACTVAWIDRNDAVPLTGSDLLPHLLAFGVGVSLLLGALAIGRREARRAIVVRSILLLIATTMSVLVGEGLIRLVVPPWPARALHGVAPAEWARAVGVDARAGESLFNSWGQKDQERSIRPADGAFRIGFIGDSFLEEGAEFPVSHATGQLLKRSNLELLNLGVSATGPDEYYERLRGVALPLGISHCCWFIFAGNDFRDTERTLCSWYGIAAVEPRPSWLGSIGLAGWNHLLTNRRRPVLQAWMQAGLLAREEQQRFDVIRHANDEVVRRLLVQAAASDGETASRLMHRLTSDDAPKFFSVLREPDGGKFRSYYLSAALQHAADGTRWEGDSIDSAWQWTQAAAALCRERGVGMTVVVVPEAFQVDERMREQWLPLTDMRDCTRSSRAAATQFVAAARAASFDVVDLHEALEGSRGSYLNCDGHWSRAGVDVVARVLAAHLGRILALPGEAR